MYSPLGLVIFVAVERTFVRFSHYSVIVISNTIRCGCLRQDQCNIACLRSCSKQKCTGNWPLLPCEAQRIVPYDLRRASLPVAAAIAIMFLGTLCSKKWYDMPHIGRGIHSLQRSTISLILDIRLITINRHARCSL